MRKGSIAIAAAAAPLTAAAFFAGRALRRRHGGSGIVLPNDRVHWETMPNAPPGIDFCPIRGDMQHGAFAVFTRFAPGVTVPLHTHSGTTHIVVISGAFLYTPEGQETIRLGPGSYFEQPAGMPHKSASDPIEGCLFFHEMERGFDVHYVESESTVWH